MHLNHSMDNSGTESIDINRRLDFMKIDDAASAAIRALKPFIERELPKGLDSFYEAMGQVPELTRFFSSSDHVNRAKQAQLGHWNNISNGDFGDDYVQKVRTIGSVHARIGLEPTWYIGGYALIADHLIRAAIKQHFPKKGLFSKSEVTADDFANSLASVVKAIFLDMDIALSVYQDEARAARQKARDEAIGAERKMIIDSFGSAMDAISRNNLAHRIDADLPDVYEELRSNFNGALENLCDTLRDINKAAAEILGATAEIAEATDELAGRTEQQAATVEETAAALEEVSTAVLDSTKRAEDASKLVSVTRQDAASSGEIVKEAVSAMGAIEASSQEIGNIIGVIDDIAFQTNLLALNAGVEAARAGDAGKGFAVVAQEVRELAQRCAGAAREIKELISTSSRHVSSGVSLVEETGQVLGSIIERISATSDIVEGIASNTNAQSEQLGDVTNTINQIELITQQNSDLVIQNTQDIHGLTRQVTHLKEKLAQFRTRSEEQDLNYTGPERRGLKAYLNDKGEARVA